MYDLFGEITLLIQQYLEGDLAADMRMLTESQNAPPLWLDMGGCIAIRPDGRFILHEWDTSLYKEENNPVLSLVHEAFP